MREGGVPAPGEALRGVRGRHVPVRDQGGAALFPAEGAPAFRRQHSVRARLRNHGARASRLRPHRRRRHGVHRRVLSAPQRHRREPLQPPDRRGRAGAGAGLCGAPAHLARRHGAHLQPRPPGVALGVPSARGLVPQLVPGARFRHPRPHRGRVSAPRAHPAMAGSSPRRVPRRSHAHPRTHLRMHPRMHPRTHPRMHPRTHPRMHPRTRIPNHRPYCRAMATVSARS